jgi:hypothetical protein
MCNGQTLLNRTDKAEEGSETFVIDFIIKFYRKKFVRNRKQFLLTLCTDNSECGGGKGGEEREQKGRDNRLREQGRGVEGTLREQRCKCFRCCSVKAAVEPMIREDGWGKTGHVTGGIGQRRRGSWVGAQ